MQITQKSVWHIVQVQYMFTIISIKLRSTPIIILENSLEFASLASLPLTANFQQCSPFSTAFNVVVPSFPSLQLWLPLPHNRGLSPSISWRTPVQYPHPFPSLSMFHISLSSQDLHQVNLEVRQVQSELCVHSYVILDPTMYHFSIL